jgi:NADH-quinone oxidoreductase subunit M
MRGYFTTAGEQNNALIIVFMGGLFFSFVYSVCMYLFFKMDTSAYQYTSFLSINLTTSPSFVEYIYYIISASLLALDGLSLVFILLTPFTIFICAAITHQLPINTTERVWYYICLLLIELFLFLAFTTTNLLIFYFAFEAVLLPIFLIIGR